MDARIGPDTKSRLALIKADPNKTRRPIYEDDRKLDEYYWLNKTTDNVTKQNDVFSSEFSEEDEVYKLNLDCSAAAVDMVAPLNKRYNTGTTWSDGIFENTLDKEPAEKVTPTLTYSYPDCVN